MPRSPLPAALRFTGTLGQLVERNRRATADRVPAATTTEAADPHDGLAEAFQNLGLSQEAAAIAARGRHPAPAAAQTPRPAPAPSTAPARPLAERLPRPTTTLTPPRQPSPPALSVELKEPSGALAEALQRLGMPADRAAVAASGQPA